MIKKDIFNDAIKFIKTNKVKSFLILLGCILLLKINWILFVLLVLLISIYKKYKSNDDIFIKIKNISLVKDNKIIEETKNTCYECDKSWYFNKKDITENNLNKFHNMSKSLSCCTGCLPALFIKDKKIIDLKRCPSCNSKNIKSEEIIHEIKN